MRKEAVGSSSCGSRLTSALDQPGNQIVNYTKKSLVFRALKFFISRFSSCIVLITILSVKNSFPGIFYRHIYIYKTIGRILLQESYIAFLRRTLSKLQPVYRNWEFVQVHTMPTWNQKTRPRFTEDGQPTKSRLSVYL